MVKICGLTRLEDVLLACDLGAWALGFVFAPSPRRLTPAAARGLIKGAAVQPPATTAAGNRGPGALGVAGLDGRNTVGADLPLTVGVFGDVPADEIARVVDEVGLDGVQLHGSAGPSGRAVRRALAGRDHPLLVIQAVPVNPEGAGAGALREAVAAAREEADVVLLDTRAAGRFGGTGAAFPWRLAREAGEGAFLLVAGGIGPENVVAALRESGAWGVDVCSGVERSPGIKDGGIMKRLFTQAGAVRRAAPGARVSSGGATPRGDDVDERQGGPDR